MKMHGGSVPRHAYTQPARRGRRDRDGDGMATAVLLLLALDAAAHAPAGGAAEAGQGKRRPPSYWCTWAAQGRLMFDTAGVSPEGAERVWQEWRVNKTKNWSDRSFLNESVLFENTSRGARGELAGMAYTWPRSIRSQLVLLLDNAWAAPSKPLRLDTVHRFPSFAAPTPTLALRKLVEKVKSLGWFGLGVWSGAYSPSPVDLKMLGDAGVTMLKFDHSDPSAHMTALARSAAPELWVTQHGSSQQFVPLSSNPHDGAPDRYPVAKAQVDARTAARSDVFTTYDFVYALSVPEALDRHWKILNHSSQLSSASAMTKATTCAVAEHGVCYSHPPSFKRIRTVQNASACCVACGEDPRCASWMFRPSTAPKQAGCLLKPEGNVTTRPDPLCTSGSSPNPKPVPVDTSYARLLGSSGVTIVTGALGGLVEPMDSNVRGLDIPQAFDTYVEGPSPRQRQHREDELGRLLRWATIAPPFGAGNDSIQASKEILFDEWHFGLYDDACTLRRNITNQTVRSGAPATVSRGGLPLPIVSQGSAPFAPIERKPFVVLTKFPDETGGAALTALVTTLGRTSVDGWTEDAADIAVDLSAEPSTQPITVGALGNMQSLTIKLGGSRAVAPRVHAQDMLALGTAQPSEVTAHTTWSGGALTVPGKLLGAVGTAARSRADDVSAPGTVLLIS